MNTFAVEGLINSLQIFGIPVSPYIFVTLCYQTSHSSDQLHHSEINPGFYCLRYYHSLYWFIEKLGCRNVRSIYELNVFVYACMQNSLPHTTPQYIFHTHTSTHILGGIKDFQDQSRTSPRIVLDKGAYRQQHIVMCALKTSEDFHVENDLQYYSFNLALCEIC